MVDEAYAYVPQRGDIVWISLDPQAGHEQAGRRPAVVISPRIYNEKARLAILCPITSHVKHYPFEVLIPQGLEVAGVILADQLKSLDWYVRQVDFICKLPSRTVNEVMQRLSALLT